MQNNLRIITDLDNSIKVMHGVGVWMEKSGLNPSKWWKPVNMNRIFLLRYTEPDEYFVAMVDNKPVASMVLQETERNQSWESVDKDNPQKALYLHWLCVHRDFAGKGLPKTLVDFAKVETKKRGFSLLRLDTIAMRKNYVQSIKV